MGTPQRGQGQSEGIEAAVEAVRAQARDLSEAADLDRLLEAASEASYVLIGEASHGTASSTDGVRD